MQEIVSQSVKVDVFLGELQAVANGVVHVSDNRKLKILVEDITILFEFEIDADNDEIKYKSRVEPEKTLIITLVNFKNQLGQGVLEPLLIGNAYKRKLFLSFWINTPIATEDKRVFSYAVYLGDAI